MSDQSLQSRLLEMALRLAGRKPRAQHLRSRIARGGAPERSRPPLALYTRHRIASRKVFGSTVWTMAPVERTGGPHVLFLHGGAYVDGMARKYWGFLDRLVEELHCTVLVPEYPLAPGRHAEDVSALVMTLYRELGAAGGAASLTVIGTSAGGGIALALAQQAQAHGIALPARLVLVSPWLDATLSNPAIGTVAPTDPVLDPEGLRDAGRLYAGSRPVTDPLVSPLYGPLEGLPPITLFIGTHDVMLPDCRKFRDMAERAGVDLDYYEYEAMVHEWLFLPLPEAASAQAELLAAIGGGEQRFTAVRLPPEAARPADTGGRDRPR